MKQKSVKARRDRLLRHCRNVHPTVMTLLRTRGIEPADATLTVLSQLHDLEPHPSQDAFLKED